MRTLRKHARNDDDQAERRKGPFKLASYEQDHEGKKFKSSKVVYSFWSASKYVLILSLMLWWLPMFGQMIAGYVGGRRAGSPWKGVVAAIVPVVALYGIMAGFSTGFFPTHVGSVAIAPAAIATVLTHDIPLLSPYLHFTSEYVGSFVDALAGASPYGINTYVLTVAFAYIGGVLAEQNRREIEYTSGSVTSNTMVLVHDPRAAYAGGSDPKGQGWFSSIGSHLHMPAIFSGAPGGLLSRGRRDAGWANASEMHYDEQAMDIEDDGVMVSSDDQYFHPRQRHHHHKHHNNAFNHPHHRDPWQPKQKRRGAPNYSAKPRFRYQQYEDQKFQNNSFRRSKSFPRFTVAPNPKSIRRAERLIDSDWGNKKYPSYREVSRGDDYEEEPQETEAVAVPKREHHRPENQWDQI